MNEEEFESPYCPICTGCGEEGCCSATICEQHPDGHYCGGYLKDLQFGYKMYHKLMELIYEDEKYKEQIDVIRDDLYDKIYKVKDLDS